jgi:hypothetical protein
LPEGLDGGVELALTDARVGDLAVPHAEVKVTLSEAEAQWALVNGDLLGGVWSGVARVSRDGSDVGLTVNGKGRQADLRVVAGTFMEQPGFTGSGDIEFDLTARGRHASALVASVDGRVAVTARDGVLPGFDLRAFERDLESASGALGVQLAAEETMAHGQTAYRDLSGEFKVLDGVMQPLSLAADVGSGRMSIDGKLDVSVLSVNGKAEFSILSGEGLPPIAYVFTGDLEKPSGYWETWELEKAFEAIAQAEAEAAAAAAAAAAAEADSQAIPNDPGNSSAGSSRGVESDDLAPPSN